MAARFWIGQSSGGNYNSTDWSLTSGGTGGQAAPTSSDDVTFDGAGTNGNTNCTITANANALSLTFTTGYTATITLNATFTLTVAGNFTDRTQHTWTINSTQAGALTISAASTITSNSKTFPGNVIFSGANTKTLSGDWTITGTLDILNATTINHTTAENLSCAGLTVGANITGTNLITITGGTWSGAGGVANNVTIAGNVTVSGTVFYLTGTLTYSSGTVTTTSSTLNIQGSCTLNTGAISWNNITIGVTSTLTLNALLTVTGTFLVGIGLNVTFAGTFGITVGTFTSNTTSGSTFTFVNGVTYTITTALNCFSSRIGTIPVFTSDHATNKANITLTGGASCNVLASFTRIDASGGRPIYTFNGTITTCINVLQFTDAGTYVINRAVVVNAIGSY